MLYKPKTVQNMKRESGSDICYINGNITVLIFNINFPLTCPQNSILTSTAFLKQTVLKWICLQAHFPFPRKVSDLFKGREVILKNRCVNLGEK